jgi:hypothetical protein
MVGLMARYHGPLWDAATLRNDFPMLKTPFDYQVQVNQTIPFEHGSYTGIERAASVIPAPLMGKDKELWRTHMRSLQLQSRPPHTLQHWDMHIGNWYATGDGRMGLSDWGMVRGRNIGDVSYALSSALTVEDRRAWERDLLALYIDLVQQNGAPALTFEDAWLEYRQSMFHPFFYWVTTIGAGPMLPDMQPDAISLANIERMGQAIVDLDSLAAVAEA